MLNRKDRLSILEDGDKVCEVSTDNRCPLVGLVDPVSGEVSLPHRYNKEDTIHEGYDQDKGRDTDTYNLEITNIYQNEERSFSFDGFINLKVKTKRMLYRGSPLTIKQRS